MLFSASHSQIINMVILAKSNLSWLIFPFFIVIMQKLSLLFVFSLTIAVNINKWDLFVIENHYGNISKSTFDFIMSNCKANPVELMNLRFYDATYPRLIHTFLNIEHF